MSLTKVVTLFFLVIGSQVMAQVTRSPFTNVGLGETYDPALINNQGMAGLGVSVPQYFYINNQNPALLLSPMPGAHNYQTIFAAGVITERKTIASDTLEESTKGGNLNYLALAMPLKANHWVTSIALTPFTSVRYKSQYESAIIGDPNPVQVTEEGDGGITQLSWSNAVRVYRGLQIGLKTGYYFGSITRTYQTKLINTSQPNNLSAAFDEKTSVKGFGLGAGVVYSIDSLFSRGRYRVTFGASYDFGASLKGDQLNVIYRLNNFGDQRDIDTLQSVRGTVKLPSSFSAGVTLTQRGRWNIGMEASMRDWSGYRDINGNPESAYTKSFRYVLGGELTPDSYSENYWKRVTYRAGVSLEKTPYRSNVSSDLSSPAYRDVQDIGANFGLSLPAGRSSIDLAVRYGKRGERGDNLFEETYVRMFLGLTFNDQWFIKRRFD